MNNPISSIPDDINQIVSLALAEDIGDGDITAQLIPAESTASAKIITREKCVVAGRPWVDEVFQQLDATIAIDWHIKEGQQIAANETLFELRGNARSLLTGERTALNFLQLLSGTATRCQYYADLVAGTEVKLLDTRKTIPGLRSAQKYAVTCGGCYNHRIGLARRDRRVVDAGCDVAGAGGRGAADRDRGAGQDPDLHAQRDARLRHARRRRRLDRRLPPAPAPADRPVGAGEEPPPTW